MIDATMSQAAESSQNQEIEGITEEEKVAADADELPDVVLTSLTEEFLDALSKHCIYTYSY